MCICVIFENQSESWLGFCVLSPPSSSSSSTAAAAAVPKNFCHELRLGKCARKTHQSNQKVTPEQLKTFRMNYNNKKQTKKIAGKAKKNDYRKCKRASMHLCVCEGVWAWLGLDFEYMKGNQSQKEFTNANCQMTSFLV